MDQILSTVEFNRAGAPKDTWGSPVLPGVTKVTNKIMPEPGEEHLAPGGVLGFLICNTGTVAELSRGLNERKAVKWLLQCPAHTYTMLHGCCCC